MVSFILFIPLGKAQYDEIFDDIPKVEESKSQSHYPPKGYTK
jgi:hypothetical protein